MRPRYVVMTCLGLAPFLTGADNSQGCGSATIDPSALENSQVTVQKIAQVTGVVTAAPSGSAIAGATVRMEDKSAVTDNAGGFFLNELSVGEQTLTVQASGYEQLTTVVTLAAGANALGALTLQPLDDTDDPPVDPPVDPPADTASLLGVVVDDGSSAAVAGATVSIAGQNATSDSAGAFAFTDLPLGEQALTVTAPGYDPRSMTLTLVAGSNDVGTVKLVAGEGPVVPLTVEEELLKVAHTTWGFRFPCDSNGASGICVMVSVFTRKASGELVSSDKFYIDEPGTLPDAHAGDLACTTEWEGTFEEIAGFAPSERQFVTFYSKSHWCNPAWPDLFGSFPRQDLVFQVSALDAAGSPTLYSVWDTGIASTTAATPPLPPTRPGADPLVACPPEANTNGFPYCRPSCTAGATWTGDCPQN